MDINPNFSWGTDNSGNSINYNVQNLVTHEFGHWLQLQDFYDQSCSEITMYHYISIGEIKKITLDTADIEAINWQYP